MRRLPSQLVCQIAGQLGRWQVLATAGVLPGPQGREVGAPLAFGFGAQGRDGGRGQREGGRGRADGAQLLHDAVDDAACWPAGEHVGEGGDVGLLALEGRAVHGAGGGLGAGEVGGADLYTGSTQGHGGGHAGGIGNATGRDHRHLHGLHDLGQQGEGADLSMDIVGEEHASVPAGFEPLRDDSIGAVGLQPACFVDRGGRGQHFGAPAFHARHQVCRGQAEMKAHDRGLERCQQLGHVGAEGQASWPGRDGIHIDAKLVEVRRQSGVPGGFALGVRRGRCVAEEVDVVRPGGLGLEGRQLLAERVWGEHGAGQ